MGYLKKRLLILIMLLPLVLMPIVSAAVVFAVSPALNPPQAQVATTGSNDRLGIALGAGLVVGLATLGAGLAISSAGTAAISALAEKPDTFFRSFLVVALAEALAIYGLIMGILLWLKL
jgi:V/A-type H+/Na+-transporting ATPase subunit K